MTSPSIPSPDMPRGSAPPNREERLAAKLRENLRRRKVQARALGGTGDGAEQGAADPAGESDGALSKPDPSG
ncbi:hypothetical protein ACFOON_17405 [Novosphingobium piscinae]|uniref:Uncharacterized protein n=1 Tax=Novosphingobium piscinae TaxID=1507448 RepID=A0A7X1G1I6_9SPHN|nr:hypothetical protein [Novosphingobium piscinae]MBC2670292.1 hypothetical protein [Novosphingobium piscinae]